MGDGVVLRGLCVRATDTTLVHDVHLELRPGRITGLLGDSGAGKTLTARALLGLVELTPGVVAADLAITCDGEVLRPYEGLPASRRERDRAFRTVRGRVMAYMPQHAREALDPLVLTGHQIRGSARLAGGPDDPLPYLARAGFSRPAEIVGRYPHELSGGMAQRVLLAQVLARRSRFLLADEPTTGVDPSVRRALLTELRRLVDTEGLSVLLITHDLDALLAVADEVVVLEDGRTVEVLPAADLARGAAGSRTARGLLEAHRALLARWVG